MTYTTDMEMLECF